MIFLKTYSRILPLGIVGNQKSLLERKKKNLRHIPETEAVKQYLIKEQLVRRKYGREQEEKWLLRDGNEVLMLLESKSHLTSQYLSLRKRLVKLHFLRLVHEECCPVVENWNKLDIN